MKKHQFPLQLFWVQQATGSTVTMHKLLALLVLAGVALANPTCPRRCSNYNLYSGWNANVLLDKEWVVAASSASGSVFGWRSEYDLCDAYFTYGIDSCGSCTYLRFLQNPKYTGDLAAYTMVQSAWNSYKGQYDYTENFFGRAYRDHDNIYRAYTREAFDRTYFGYRELVDPNFIPYDAYNNDLAYSVGILSYCPKNNIVILIVCNNFQYLNYGDNFPTVVVLSQNSRLTLDQKAWIISELERNKINPYGIVLRDNFNCRDRTIYNPNIYW